MPPLAANRRQLAPLPAPRVWLLTAAGLLAVGVIGAFFSPGERQPVTAISNLPSASRLPGPSKSSPMATQWSAPLKDAVQSDTSTASPQSADFPTEEASWPEEEKERIRNWARSSPQAVALWGTMLPAGGNRHFAIETASLAWGDIDPSSAAQWAWKLPDETERALALADIADEAVRSDPILAIKLAGSLPDSSYNEIVPRAAMEWAAQDPATAADWARQIPAESLRATTLAGIATVWSEQDPVTAANLAIKELPAGRLQSDTIVSIVQRWAQQSPDDAEAWVNQFPGGDLRDAAMENLKQASRQKSE